MTIAVGWRLCAIPIAALAALSCCIALADVARAHAGLVASEPADGAMVAAPPPRVTLTFNEPVSALVIRLVGPDGASADIAAVSEGLSSLAVALPQSLSRGTHTLSWHVVSLDGHPVGGTVVFAIGEWTASSPVAAKASSNLAVERMLWLCRLLLYAALFVSVGGSVFLAWIANPDGGAASVRVASILGMIVAPVSVGLQGADALGGSSGNLLHGAVWRAGIGTAFGWTAALIVVALICALLALRQRRTVARALSLLGLATCGLALAASGHASAASLQWMMRPAVFMHGITVAFWAGSLLPLAMTLNGRAAPEPLLTFSRAIGWAVALLALSGALLAVVQVGDVGLLLRTDYGKLLCVKLLLVAVLLGIAAWNRHRLTPAIAAGQRGARKTLRRLIAVEMVILTAIFGVVAAWRFTPPPRVVAAMSVKPARVHLHTPRATADVTFMPGRAGLVDVTISVRTGDFVMLDSKEVQLTISSEAIGIEAISRPAVRSGDGMWRLDRFPIPQKGTWQIQLDVLIDDFEKVKLDGAIAIGET